MPIGVNFDARHFQFSRLAPAWRRERNRENNPMLRMWFATVAGFSAIFLVAIAVI